MTQAEVAVLLEERAQKMLEDLIQIYNETFRAYESQFIAAIQDEIFKRDDSPYEEFARAGKEAFVHSTFRKKNEQMLKILTSQYPSADIQAISKNLILADDDCVRDYSRDLFQYDRSSLSLLEEELHKALRGTIEKYKMESDQEMANMRRSVKHDNTTILIVSSHIANKEEREKFVSELFSKQGAVIEKVLRGTRAHCASLLAGLPDLFKRALSDLETH